MTEDAPAF